MGDTQPMHEAQDAIAAVRAAGQTPVLVIIPDTCGCGAAWRAAFNADRCVTSTAAFRNEVERHHFAVRTREGKAVADVPAANRFAAYGALNAIVHRGGNSFRWLQLTLVLMLHVDVCV